MVDVAGAAQEFADLAKNLALVGEVELRKELYDSINEAARPIEGDVRQSMPVFLPNPYAKTLDEDLAFRTSKRTGADPGVVIVATARGVKKRRIRRLNQGTLWHPTFGNRKAGRYQQLPSVRPGFFDQPIDADAPVVRDKILEAMRRVEEKALGR